MSESTDCDCPTCRCRQLAKEVIGQLPANSVAVLALGAPGGNVAITFADEQQMPKLILALRAVAESLEQGLAQRVADHTRRN